MKFAGVLLSRQYEYSTQIPDPDLTANVPIVWINFNKTDTEGKESNGGLRWRRFTRHAILGILKDISSNGI
jgi:hypothetical protein